MSYDIKITYFNYLYDIKGVSAGSANKAVGFMDALNAIGHKAHLFWRMDQPEDYEGSSLRLRVRGTLKRRLSRTLHDSRKLLNNGKFLFQEVRILRTEKPDVFFLRPELYGFSAMAAAKWLHLPVVLEVDAPTAWEHRHRSGIDKIKLGPLPEWIERWNWKMGDRIITISKTLKTYLALQGVDPDKITVIPNGANPDRFKPQVGGRKIRRLLGIGDRQVVVGWAGSLFGWSGLETLLELTKRILSNRRNVAFLFVGGGKNREIIEHAFDRSEINRRVFMTGTVPYDEVPCYVDAMDVVVVPYPKLNFWYPSSMKLFEYMSAGKAVVASAVEQVKDVIRDGTNGFLFQPDSHEEFVRKILALMNNPSLRKRMGRYARKTVLDQYTWVGHAKRMERIFSSLLKR